MYKRVVIKLGSNVISEDGKLSEVIVEQIVREIADLRKKGIEVVLVTSGAVAMGKGVINLPGADSIVSKQVFASIGQIKLMSIYSELFAKHGCVCAQVLVTKEDFRDRQHYLNMRNCLENLLRNGVVPVVNENDVIAVTELIFTDNDELAALIASQLNADVVIILTSVEGVLDGNPNDPQARVIPEIDFTKDSFDHHITDDRSASGRGGMRTKFTIAKKLSAQGIVTHIAGGRNKDILEKIVSGAEVGTRFIPAKKLSSIKRRIAFSEGLAKGAVQVNECTEEIISSRKTISLLPIGVVKIVGTFEKGDVIEIRNEKDQRLGFGIAQYSSETAQAHLGQKGARALIHCDYLFVE